MIVPTAAELAVTKAAASFGGSLPKVSLFNSASLKSVGSTITSIFGNKGVQLGIGLGSTGLGLSSLSSSLTSSLAPLGVPQASPLLLIGIVGALIFLLIMVSRR